MTDWTTLEERMNTAGMRVFGEPVTLPGAVEVTGVFDPKGEPPDPWGSEVGLATRLGQQPSPVVFLLDGDVAGLNERDTVTVRGKTYLVTRIDDEGNGLSRVWLMLDRTDAGSPPEGERWR